MDGEDTEKESALEHSEDNKSGINSDLIRGHINTIILRTLYDRDKYGYEIIEEIESKSHGQYTLKQPTLYSALKRLESQGYITAYWKSDEVSQGGRRKYYTLTESGKEITEKNQAEWEYSRSVIDNLISDRSFDFSQPAPTPVDFKILKSSTSRVPIVKEDGEAEEIEVSDEKTEKVIVDESAATSNDKAEEATTEVVTSEVTEIVTETVAPETTKETVTTVAEEAPAEEVITETITSETDTTAIEEAPSTEPEKPALSKEEAEAIRVHENYLKLISEPCAPPREEVAPVEAAESIDTESLIYNKKPETERDYRNLVNGLFSRTLKRTDEPPAPVVEKREPAPAPTHRSPSIRVAIEETAVVDAPDKSFNASEYTGKGAKPRKFERNAVLFKCSLIVTVIMLFEFVMCLIFKDRLEIDLAYPFVIFALAAAQAFIFIALYATGSGRNTRKPATLTYLTASIIVTAIIMLIIVLIAIALNVNFSKASDIMAKIVIPCIIALNIPIFTVSFWLFSKN